VSAPSEYVYPDITRRWDHTPILPPIVKALQTIPAEGSVLDIGCGNGAVLADLQKLGSWKLSGVETSESGVAMARSQGFDVRLLEAGADLTSLFGRHSFDLVISVEVIEHVYEPRTLLAQTREVLRPRGRFVITTPYHGYLKNLLIAVLGKGDSHYNPLWDGGHVKFWSRKTLSTALREAGFEDIQFYGAGRVPYFWKSMILTATAL